jgi:hypothetical protein
LGLFEANLQKSWVDALMHTQPTPNYFDPAIWAIALALSAALVYLVLFE